MVSVEALIINKKAAFNYEVLEKLTAGIELLGFEVKSLRKKQGALEGAYAIVRGGEAFLVGATIPPYQPKNTPKEYDPARARRLLLTKEEIRRIGSAADRKGLTVVPLSVYNAGRKMKVTLGIARGKKKFDKRETIKRRDAERDIRRELKER